MNEDRDRKFLEKRKKGLRRSLWVGIIGIVVGLIFSATCYILFGRMYEEASHRSRDFRSNVKTMDRKTLEKSAVKRDDGVLKLAKLLREVVSLFILMGISGVCVAGILGYRTEKRCLEIISRLQETS